jgi:hypothetical protein
MRSRKVVIRISLVEESIEKRKEDIEREISEELSKASVPIPWLKTVEEVSVFEE